MVLGVVWLGSQPYVQVSGRVSASPSPTQEFKIALDTEPKVIEVKILARGVRDGNREALKSLRVELGKRGLADLENSGQLAGLVLTFSGGDSCSDHGSAESTSLAVNRLLSKWYPKLVSPETVTEAYVNFSCKGSNHLKIKIYTFAKVS